MTGSDLAARVHALEMSNATTINFACGCFSSFFVAEGQISSALACCAAHERPHQTIAGILGDTHEIAFREIYRPIPVKTWDEHVQELQAVFTDARVAPEIKDRHSVSFTVAVPAGRWNRTEIPVVYDVPQGFPFAVPECFWSPDAHLRYADGSKPWQSGVQPRNGVPMMWFWFQPTVWRPQQDGLLTYARLIKLALNGHFDRHDDDE